MYKVFEHHLLIGQNIVYLPNCQSTNDTASDLIAKGEAKEGTVVITSHQTKGRGQRGNTWEVEPDKNLTFSIILMPHFLIPAQQFVLNIAVSLGIHKALSNLLPHHHLKIKWPNDIYYQNKKLGGILIENILKFNKIEYSIVGIGININQIAFPIQTATSLVQVLKKDFHLELILEMILKQVEILYLKLKNLHFGGLKQSYLEHLYWFQEEHTFLSLKDGEKFKGEILGVNELGMLAVRIGTQMHFFNFKEIKFIE